jgi:hypothetical protein
MGLCTLVLVIWWAMWAHPLPPQPSVPFGPGDTLCAQVLRVIDGTTRQVDLDGGRERVGYFGIEALGQSTTEAKPASRPGPRRPAQARRVGPE